MSTNPVSMRLPIGIEGKAEPEVVETIQYHDDAITDLQQAIPKLKSQIDSLVTTVGAVTASSSSSSGSSQSITNIINNIGFVNPQQGVTIYATQPSDEGALIILSDASPIAVTLTSAGSIPGITLPWYTFFLNLGSGTATLTPATGTISYPGNLGAASMPVIAEAMALVYFDGTNFWAATVIAGVSGSGTTGFVPVWTSSTALGDSHIDDGVTTPGVVTSSKPFSVQAHSALGIGSTIDSFPTTAPDGGFPLSPKAIVVAEETVTGDLENGSYLGLTMNPSAPPSTTSAIGSLTEVIAEGSNMGGTALFGGWQAAISNVNSPDSAPALGGSVSGAYVNGTAEIPFAAGFTADFINQSTAIIDYGSGIDIYLGQNSTGHVDIAEGLTASYNAGSGSTADLVNMLHIESPNNGGDVVTDFVGLQIDALEAPGVGTAIPIKSDSVSTSLFAGPVAMKSLGIGVNTVIPDTITGYHGNGAGDVDVQMSDGTGSAGNMAIFDAGGGLTDGGPPAGGGVGFAQIFLLMGA